MSNTHEPPRSSSRLGRRLSSAPHSIFSSLENASSRLSLNNLTKRSVSRPRSASNVSDQSALQSNEDYDGFHSRQAAQGMTVQPSLKEMEKRERSRSSSRLSMTSQTERRHSIQAGATDDNASVRSTNSAPKWYQRFTRTNSENRLSKALETSEAAFVAPVKPHNPYARQRTSQVPVKPKTIVGQTAQQAVEIGGHASNASQILPRSLLPSSSIEIPYIVDACITWLMENDAAMTPGIFRINGSNQSVKAVLEHFSGGCVRMPLQDIDTPSGQPLSVFDIASVLKKFLVLLPGGLFGQACFEDLLEISEDTHKIAAQQVAADTAQVLRSITPEKRSIAIVLFAFLRHIADRASYFSVRTNPSWQEAGYMNSQSLSIVFSPTCLGTKEAHSDMSRSSTAQSERSFHSDSSSPIEEAVAVAKQGAQVIKMIIDHWSTIVPYFTSDRDEVAYQVTKLDVIGRKPLDLRRPDGSAPRETNGQLHSRTESVDTVTMKRCNCDHTIPLLNAQIEALNAKVIRLEQSNLECMDTLRTKSEEIMNLYTRNVELERDLMAMKLGM